MVNKNYCDTNLHNRDYTVTTMAYLGTILLIIHSRYIVIQVLAKIHVPLTKKIQYMLNINDAVETGDEVFYLGDTQYRTEGPEGRLPTFLLYPTHHNGTRILT